MHCSCVAFVFCVVSVLSPPRDCVLRTREVLSVVYCDLGSRGCSAAAPPLHELTPIFCLPPQEVPWSCSDLCVQGAESVAPSWPWPWPAPPGGAFHRLLPRDAPGTAAREPRRNHEGNPAGTNPSGPFLWGDVGGRRCLVRAQASVLGWAFSSRAYALRGTWELCLCRTGLLSRSSLCLQPSAGRSYCCSGFQPILPRIRPRRL